MNQPSGRVLTLRGLLAVAVLLCALPALTQQTLGSLNGTVLDGSGGTVAGATVSVTDSAINITQTTTTQKTGFFQIFNLPIGTYAVTVTQQGYEKSQVKGITESLLAAVDHRRHPGWPDQEG